MKRKAVSNIVSIDFAREGPEPQGPTPASAHAVRKSNPNQWTRRQALRQFFLLGSGVWKVQRETGVPTKDLENDLREFGWAEFERRQKRAA